MKTYITLGKVTLSFRDENDTLCSIRRANHYQRQKPKSWGENDFYLVTHEQGEIYANFSGTGTIEVNGEYFGVMPDKLPLKKATNKITVTSKGISYTFLVHLVLCVSEEKIESRSKGITYNEENELWEFDALGFFENLFWLFSDAYREEEYLEEFSIEGRLEGEQPLEQEIEQNDLSLQGQAEISEPSVAESVQDTTPAYTAPEPVFMPEPTHHYSPPAETHHYSAPEPSHHSSYDHSSHSDHSSSYDSGRSYDSGSSSCDSGGCDGGGGD